MACRWPPIVCYSFSLRLLFRYCVHRQDGCAEACSAGRILLPEGLWRRGLPRLRSHRHSAELDQTNEERERQHFRTYLTCAWGLSTHMHTCFCRCSMSSKALSGSLCITLASLSLPGGCSWFREASSFPPVVYVTSADSLRPLQGTHTASRTSANVTPSSSLFKGGKWPKTKLGTIPSPDTEQRARSKSACVRRRDSRALSELRQRGCT